MIYQDRESQLKEGNPMLPKALEILETYGSTRVDFGSPGVDWLDLIQPSFGCWLDSSSRRGFLRQLGNNPAVEVVTFPYYGIIPQPKLVFPKVHWTGSFDEPLKKAIQAVQTSEVDHTFMRTKIMDTYELVARVTGLEDTKDKPNPAYGSLGYAIFKSGTMYRGVVVFVRRPVKDCQVADEFDSLLRLRQRM